MSSTVTESETANDTKQIAAVIQRISKPDKTEHEAKLAKMNADIKDLQDRTAKIRLDLDAIQNGRTGYGDQIQAAKNVFAELRSAKDKLVQERNEITAALRQVQDKKEKMTASQRNSKSNLKFTSKEEVDQQVAKLRHQQETRSMTLIEEKRLIKEIESLQQSKQHLSKFANDRVTIEKQNELIKKLKSDQTAKNAEIDTCQDKMKAQKEELDRLYALNNAEQRQDEYSVLIRERKEIRAALDAKYQEIRDLRDAFKEANDKYHENVRAIREKKRLERQQEEERRKAEYEAAMVEYEKKMAEIHPYQDEMDLCDALLNYFEKNFAKELKDREDINDANDTQPNAPELDGLQPLQRKEEDFMVLGSDSRKKKGKGGKKSKRDQKISLPIAQIESLSSIGLLPPFKVSAIVSTVTSIKEKKKWYMKQERKFSVDAASAYPSNPSTETKAISSKKKTNFDSADQSAFPSLVETSPIASTEWRHGIEPKQQEMTASPPSSEDI